MTRAAGDRCVVWRQGDGCRYQWQEMRNRQSKPVQVNVLDCVDGVAWAVRAVLSSCAHNYEAAPIPGLRLASTSGCHSFAAAHAGSAGSKEGKKYLNGLELRIMVTRLPPPLFCSVGRKRWRPASLVVYSLNSPSVAQPMPVGLVFCGRSCSRLFNGPRLEPRRMSSKRRVEVTHCSEEEETSTSSLISSLAKAQEDKISA
jgi:hypothetical protein